jgi:dTMP kinase
VTAFRRVGAGRPAHPRGRALRPGAIALIGIDGSGKTTQAQRLAHALTAAGIPATYWQNAGGRRWFGRLARRLGSRDAQRLLGRGGLLAVESILRWLAIARALLRSALTGRLAVMDRYAVCQYASIRAHGGRRTAERLARLAYRTFPAPDVTFLLRVEPAIAYQRIEMRGTDHESLEFLAKAAAAYRSLPEYGTFVIVDAGGTPDDVTRAIQAYLASDPALPADPPRPAVPPLPTRRPTHGAAQARP